MKLPDEALNFINSCSRTSDVNLHQVQNPLPYNQAISQECINSVNDMTRTCQRKDSQNRNTGLFCSSDCQQIHVNLIKNAPRTIKTKY